jgi:hypothetical protein
MDINDIFSSWVSRIKPKERLKLQAENRFEICKSCDNYRELLKKRTWSAYCSRCSCPLETKVFSEKINPCPLNKWDSIDKLNGFETKIKDKNTLI